MSIPAPFVTLALIIAVSIALDYGFFAWKQQNWRAQGVSDTGDWLAARLAGPLKYVARWGRQLSPLAQAWRRVWEAWGKRWATALPTAAISPVDAAASQPESVVLSPVPVSNPALVKAETPAPSATEPSSLELTTMAPSAMRASVDETVSIPPSPLGTVEATVPTTAAPASPEKPVEAPSPASARMARVQISVELPEGTAVRITIEALPGTGISVNQQPILSTTVPFVPSALPSATSTRQPAPLVVPGAAAQRARWAWPRLSLRSRLTAVMHGVQSAGQRLVAAVPVRFRALDVTLFGLGLLVYLVTRLVGLDRFPIYFFTDEAVHTVLAANFVRDGFQNSYGEFLPTYFSLGSSFGLNSVSVYVQVLPYLIFGKSIFVTRATSAFITLLGTAAVALTLRDVFKVRYWWAAVLLLTITPTWFMHSRTAFEYAEVAAFYGGFIYFYLRYRCGSPRWLYGAVVMGALVFYTHGLGEVLIGATAALLFVIDLPYHFKNRAVVGRGLVLALLLALPFLRYWLAHGGEFTAQLHQRGSYWTTVGLSLGKKLSNFASEYTYGLNPLYWYFPETRDLARHMMNGYGNIWWPTLPFAILGLVQIVRKFRQPAYRVLLVTLLTTPIASALVAIGVLRMLWFLMPITVITGLGLSAVLEWLERRRWPRAVRSPATALALSLFVVLTGFSFYMLYDALTNGPLWVKDYTLYGEQYGAKQIFADTIPPYLKRDPNVRFEVTPTWANGTDLFIPFFLSPDQQARVQLRNVDYYLNDKQTIDPNAIQVMTPDEYARASASGKFKAIKIEQILPYPDGQPGFYFTRLTYADNVDQVFVAEAEARRQLAVGEFMIGGQNVTVRYSQIGNATLNDIFDGNWDSLVRGLEANPFVLEFSFPEPRPITGIAADFGSMDLTMTVLLYPPGSDTPVKLSQTWRDQPPDPHVEMKFDNAPAQVSRMRVEILNLLAGDKANIHIREFKIQP